MQGAEDEKVDYKRDGDRRRRKSGRDDWVGDCTVRCNRSVTLQLLEELGGI